MTFLVIRVFLNVSQEPKHAEKAVWRFLVFPATWREDKENHEFHVYPTGSARFTESPPLGEHSHTTGKYLSGIHNPFTNHAF
jgi:hypothetical protein